MSFYGNNLIRLILWNIVLSIAEPRSSLFENWMVIELMIDRLRASKVNRYLTM